MALSVSVCPPFMFRLEKIKDSETQNKTTDVSKNSLPSLANSTLGAV